MAKQTYAEAVAYETASADEKPSHTFGVLRIAKVTYDHYPIGKSAKGGTIGQMIDEHIRRSIHEGSLVSEVTLMFETPEQQHQLREIYE